MAKKKSDATTVTISDEESQQVERANKSGKTPVAFVHGLWLLPSSWDPWAKFFEQAGFAAVTPGWPEDPDTVEEASAHPEVFAGKSIGDIADHVAAVLGALKKRPAVIGHSLGGLLTEIVAGEKDHTVPWAIANASYKKQRRNKEVTEIVKVQGRGHSLTIDSGWQEVADTALKFVKRFV